MIDKKYTDGTDEYDLSAIPLWALYIMAGIFTIAALILISQIFRALYIIF